MGAGAGRGDGEGCSRSGGHGRYPVRLVRLHDHRWCSVCGQDRRSDDGALRLPGAFRSCEGATGPVSCVRPHRSERLADKWGVLPDTSTTNADREQQVREVEATSCRQFAAGVTAAPDPTRGGRLTVEVVVDDIYFYSDPLRPHDRTLRVRRRLRHQLRPSADRVDGRIRARTRCRSPEPALRRAPAQNTNPCGNGSVGSSRYWPMPVIQARPVTVGMTAGRRPTSAVPISRPMNRVPMNDSLTKSVSSGELAAGVQFRHPRRRAGAARRPVEPARVDRHRVPRVRRVRAGRDELHVVDMVDAVDQRMLRRVGRVDRVHDRQPGRQDVVLAGPVERAARRRRDRRSRRSCRRTRGRRRAFRSPGTSIVASSRSQNAGTFSMVTASA